MESYSATPEIMGRSQTRLPCDENSALGVGDCGDQLLEELLARPMEMAQFLRIGAGIAAALSRLHGKGLIHRDIKPANILVHRTTGEVRFLGLDRAVRLPRGHSLVEPPEIIVGTLAYMAPEQTGRMNRSIDSRSDLYSLGITLYEMLTGALPFSASDPMELVHWHIARRPTPPCARVAGIPNVISDLVLKLLEKNAGDRYQTAAGVEADLRRIREDWDSHERAMPFSLGVCDVSEHLSFSGSLYGRAAAIEFLLAAFNRLVTSGAAEFVLVSGFSGVGKSSVVNELRKAMMPRRGLFAWGKYDQQKRNIPFASMAQVFSNLVIPLLGQEETELSRWRNRIREAVGEDGQLVINLVPELAMVIGPQPPVPALSPREERNRFHDVLQRFVEAFARAEHPLVLFIDDLQWLDNSTLDWLEEIWGRSDIRHLMVVGAFRGNEVPPQHPLTRMLNAVRGDQTRVHEIELSPLEPVDLRSFVADTLRCAPDKVAPLAQLIHEKTRGNPFFTIQFITSLAEEGLLNFDLSSRTWTWDLAAIQAKGYTDNVADLVAGKINRLTQKTQEGLKQFACLGHRAKAEILALIAGESEADLHATLAEALEAGLILRLNDTYSFAHDRIQEAAYELIPAGDRAATHFKIGRSLEADPSFEGRDELIFDIVNQFNRARPIIFDPADQIHAAELNWLAGRRAKASVGFEAALIYFTVAEESLPEDAWSQHYALAFGAVCDRAECELFAGHLEIARERLDRLQRLAANRIDLARITGLLGALFTSTDQLDRAIATNLDYLRLFGINWVANPTETEARAEYDRMLRLIDGRPIEALLDLPPMINPDWQAVVEVMLAIEPAARFSNSYLFAMAIMGVANLSLEHGNCDGSCLGYAHLACVIGPCFGEYHLGFRFGQLSFDLVEQRGLQRFKAKVFTVVGHHVWPRTRHMGDALSLMRRAFVTAQERGDFTFMAFSFAHVIADRLVLGDPLAEVQAEAERGLALMRKARYGMVADCFAAMIRLIWILRGTKPDYPSFGEGFSDERLYERHLESDPALWIARHFYSIRKMQACYFLGDNAGALKVSANAQPLSWLHATFVERAEYIFYDALSHAAAFDSADPEMRRQIFDLVTSRQRILIAWKATGPENFTARVALIAAELARMDGQDLAALQSYEESIVAARKNGFINEEALGFELAGRFYVARGLETSGYAHLGHARACYKRWGADRKVRQLEDSYPGLRSALLPVATAASISLEQLDLAVVVKASQSISSEIVLDRLVESLLRIALEHAGADKGCLILQDVTGWHIAAEAVTEVGGTRLARRHAPETTSDLPTSIINHALRTRETVIIDDVSIQNLYMDDASMPGKKPKSVLCLPLFKQSIAVGALYLENGLTTHAFTNDRVAVLKLLASQAAISLENARLYENLQEAQVRMNHGERLSLTGSWTWQIATGEIYWSEETYRIWECDRAAKPTFDFVRTRVHPDDLEYFRKVTEEGLHDGRDSEFELRLVMPGGELKHIHVARHPVRDDEGQLSSFVGAVKDITERKKAEEALQKAQTELAHVARVASLGELTASIAHELNQPLAGVVTNGSAGLRWLAVDPPNLDEVREAIRRSIRDGNRAGDVIARLRALFKKTTTTKESVDLGELIAEVVALIQNQIRRHGAILQTRSTGNPRPVVTDRVQMQQVIFNLVLNAAEAMSDIDGRPREVTIVTHYDKSGPVRVSVQDNGVGLSAQNAEKIFSAFYTTKPGGMGMGLSICRSIIENHGGYLWVEANQGPGVTFAFTIGEQ